MMAALLRRGVGPPGIWLLTTRGRKTGALRTTPVSLVEDDTGRYLVSPYGAPAWVHNARAAGSVTLRRGRHSETLTVTELEAADSARVLKRYVEQERIVRPWFDAPHDGPVEAFVAEAERPQSSGSAEQLPRSTTRIKWAATLEDVGNVAAFVASDRARTMTAATVNISCGALVD
jgi:deazaflavin-dependent oxidoreductase (nitroreductase family)